MKKRGKVSPAGGQGTPPKNSQKNENSFFRSTFFFFIFFCKKFFGSIFKKEKKFSFFFSIHFDFHKNCFFIFFDPLSFFCILLKLVFHFFSI